MTCPQSPREHTDKERILDQWEAENLAGLNLFCKSYINYQLKYKVALSLFNQFNYYCINSFIILTINNAQLIIMYYVNHKEKKLSF